MMRLGNLFLFLQEAADIRTITIHPWLVKLLGGLKETVFFTNIVQWIPSENREKEIYKSIEQIEEETGLSRKEQMNARKNLRSLGIMKERHAKMEHRLYFSLDLEGIDRFLESREVPKGDLPPHKQVPKGDEVGAQRGFRYKEQGNNKRIKDKGVQDNEILTESFEIFYSTYPRKVNRQKALQVWMKLKPPPQLVRVILRAVEEQKQSSQWTKDGGQFIPHPTTWLNGKRWEDEIKEESHGESKKIEPAGYAGIREALRRRQSGNGV